MRVSVVLFDGFVSIDGVGCDGVDLSSLATDIHAIQWYDTHGEIERVDSRGRIVQNEVITDFDPYMHVVALWEQRMEAVRVANSGEIPLASIG
jgi:hypothetical protein